MRIIFIVEELYGILTNFIFRCLNPFKKIMIKTEAKVHKFNNKQAVLILKENGFTQEYYLFKYYLLYINNGSLWADLDFKSSSHFYSPFINKGLFGQPNSRRTANKYYDKAKKAWKKQNFEKAMFYLGACTHIIQDLTVPQHVVVKLLDDHRPYENYVKFTYKNVAEYKTIKEPIILSNVDNYLNFNALKAIKSYKKYRHLGKRSKFHMWSIHNLPLAQRTTAGCFITFLEDVGYYN
ncbi:phospholipase C [Natranaerovirga pectinivora]|uniref:Phospholipase C n=1 Tax=Natranaerovirga pectinivora TaxID=682400 RepID=A0A4R3MU51_9FIRM|nr:zinc dependent phospholipase C family protein [Natranaerovirga pectinivora]TCT16806.1 phospholipase C [Natranaerovirga pectinivora]